jgi:hypothetical protein
LIVVGPFVLFLLAIVLFVLLRYTDSDYPFGIFKLFLYKKMFLGMNNIFVCWLSVIAIIRNSLSTFWLFELHLFQILCTFVNNLSLSRVDGRYYFVSQWIDNFNIPKQMSRHNDIWCHGSIKSKLSYFVLRFTGLCLPFWYLQTIILAYLIQKVLYAIAITLRPLSVRLCHHLRFTFWLSTLPVLALYFH